MRTRRARIDPRIDEPSTPPSCTAMPCRPPASPASSRGALAMIASVEATTTKAIPSPMPTSDGASIQNDDPVCSCVSPSKATVVMAKPTVIGTRAPKRVVIRPAKGEVAANTPMSGKSRRPAPTASRCCTFWR